MIRTMMAVGVLAGGVGWAQSSTPMEHAPKVGSQHKLKCPPGTTQFGGPRSNFGAFSCERRVGSERIVHGPIISFDDLGHVVEVGQMAENYREGTWRFYDASGRLVGVTEFKRGEYHGRRTRYSGEGQVQLDERWVNGKREGQQLMLNSSGVLVSTEYRANRPVSP